jgi:hypothetical protein
MGKILSDGWTLAKIARVPERSMVAAMRAAMAEK